jgi:mannose-6-phosphate isomerase-like protein (cupin superfamily)
MRSQEVHAAHPLVVRAGEGEVLPLIGNLRLSDAQTRRGFEVIEYSGPATPPPHVHRNHDEVFYILEGSFNFVLGHEPVEAPRGALVFVPRGTRHGFTVEPDSKALLFIIPGGLGGFFRELSAGLAADKPSGEIRASLAGKYDSFPVITDRRSKTRLVGMSDG